MKYSLVETKIPENKNSGLGGIKLIYLVFKEYSTTQRGKKVIFLKPFKERWAIEGKSQCKKGEWGNRNSPYANVWLELKSDYTSLDNPNDYEIIMATYKKVNNQKLIKNLNNQSQKFNIDDPNEEPITSFKKKFLLTLGLIGCKIKERILIT